MVLKQNSTFMEGLKVLKWTRNNVLRLNQNAKENQPISLLLGIAYVVNTVIDPKIMKNKKKGIKKCVDYIQQGYDSCYFSESESFVLWEPFCAFPIAKETFTSKDLTHLLSNDFPSVALHNPIRITFKKPSITSNHSQSKAMNTKIQSVLSKTMAAGLSILEWDGQSLDSFDIGKEVVDKLLFANINHQTKYDQLKTKAFCGIRLLDNLLESNKDPILYLLRCLEFFQSGFNLEATEQLTLYVGSLHSIHSPAHPLILLALARVEKVNSLHLIQLFLELCNNGSQWLGENEGKLRINPIEFPTEESETVLDKWNLI
jgi:hypothetical protein